VINFVYSFDKLVFSTFGKSQKVRLKLGLFCSLVCFSAKLGVFLCNGTQQKIYLPTKPFWYVSASLNVQERLKAVRFEHNHKFRLTTN